MPRVTCDLTISLDGYAAGPDQSEAHPLSVGAERLHRWMFEAPAENRAERDAITAAGAFVMGRDMFGPGRARGARDESWRGWWGEDPPYHTPVFASPTNPAHR